MEWEIQVRYVDKTDEQYFGTSHYFVTHERSMRGYTKSTAMGMFKDFCLRFPAPDYAVQLVKIETTREIVASSGN